MATETKKKAKPQTVRAIVQTLASLTPDLLRLERDIKVLGAREADSENYGKRRPAWGPVEKRLAAIVGTSDVDVRALLQAISVLGTAVGEKVTTMPLPPPNGYEATSGGKFRAKPDRRRRELAEPEIF